jgi:hypothetical protein
MKMRSRLKGSYVSSVDTLLKDGFVDSEISTRQLRENNTATNGGVVVAIVFAGLITIALLAALFCRYYDALKKCLKKSTKLKKKRDARDYKATEVIVKKFEKSPETTVVGDSTTASVVSAVVPSLPAERHAELNDSVDFSGSSWTTLGNGAIIGIAPEVRPYTTSHTPRSPRWEEKVVPVDYPVN